ncbi:proline-, glutamic acid- and leucine-rich protein 1-like isoform X1 [Strongylocentrotus purpuratus]|uniref:Uncharacterized protein n=1 Tax=Strongylocentrotus purpuratus TaxID=7668 RepID=A0A7M7P0X2_STRPU|nr:proline-, glutamic acid- and leucine-rich protein 1-like isoform X1 [Strongylocentrotus purpuratus]|eukprot:XP_011678212.1 PREDICTED: proline-, glutamic acid- and leucine-rich protein 1 isoform X1 [Strongylocentrotus purpuratus]
MKMTSQLVTLVLAVFVCSAAVVYSQTSPPSASPPTVLATEPITTPRPAVATTPPPVDNGTPAPSANGTDAPTPVVTDAPMTSAKDGDDDGMKGDGDGQKGHDDDEEGGGGLRRGDIALAILATILVVAVICTFIGLCYWKYKGNSYVTVTADTTYRQ